MPADPSIEVVVGYALPERQWLVPLRLPGGSTVADAIAASGLRRQMPDGALDAPRVGVFGKPCALDTVLRDGDRVELYRPLECDPKDVRRARAESGRRPGQR